MWSASFLLIYTTWALALLMELDPHKDRAKFWQGWRLITAAISTELQCQTGAGRRNWICQVHGNIQVQGRVTLLQTLALEHLYLNRFHCRVQYKVLVFQPCRPCVLFLTIECIVKWWFSTRIDHYKITKIVRALWLAERRGYMRVRKHGCVT